MVATKRGGVAILTEEKKDEKERRKSIAPWLIVILLLVLVMCRVTCQKQEEVSVPGNEYFSQEQQEQKPGQVGTSIPASAVVRNGEAIISITNTGSCAYTPYTLVEGKEVYRSSRILEPGEKVTVLLPVDNTAKECVTYIQVPTGEKFSVTTKLVH